MKILLFIAITAFLSSFAFAQQQGGLQGSQVQSNPESQQQGGQPGNQGQNRQQRFQDMKQRMLDRIDRRINTLQDAKSCVEQAQNPQALKGCRPQREE